MLVNNHLPTGLQEPPHGTRHRPRARHRAQHLTSKRAIEGFLIHTESLQPGDIFHAARDDGVDVAESGFLDGFAESRVEIDAWLDAVDLGDFGAVVAGELVSGARADFEDGAVGGSDEGGKNGFEFAFGDPGALGVWYG